MSFFCLIFVYFLRLPARSVPYITAYQNINQFLSKFPCTCLEFCGALGASLFTSVPSGPVAWPSCSQFLVLKVHSVGFSLAVQLWKRSSLVGLLQDLNLKENEDCHCAHCLRYWVDRGTKWFESWCSFSSQWLPAEIAKRRLSLNALHWHTNWWQKVWFKVTLIINSSIASMLNYNISQQLRQEPTISLPSWFRAGH